VVPAYNEEKRIGDSIRAIESFLVDREHETIVVDDGSADSTLEILAQLNAEFPHMTVISHSPNRGKGYAVRHGMLAASGDLVLLTDADLSAPIGEMTKLEQAVEAGAAVAVASRAVPDSIITSRQPFYRELGGRALNRPIQALAVPGIHDTQCGFKLFTNECAQTIFPNCFLNGWSFDVEVLYLARRFGFEIKEVGVRWEHREGSKVHPLVDGVRLALDVLKIRMHEYKHGTADGS
jgi:dolichyl-phosphate beta-glucosyltransferase